MGRLTDIELAEMRYWRAIVADFTGRYNSWVDPDKAIDDILRGVNSRDTEWLQLDRLQFPILRWRELNARAIK
jgi:hypothetical protein